MVSASFCMIADMWYVYLHCLPDQVRGTRGVCVEISECLRTVVK